MSKDITPKTIKKYRPSRLEVAKTVAIAVLVTSIVAFSAGIRYANNQQNELRQAISQVQAVAPEK